MKMAQMIMTKLSLAMEGKFRTLASATPSNIKVEHPRTNHLTPKGLREPKRPFLILGRLPYVPKVVGVFETS
jgi:hypothetical protein